MRSLTRWLFRLALLLILLLAGPAAMVVSGQTRLDASWYSTDRSSLAGLAPAGAAHPAAVVQIYSARAFSWRGAFAVHSWIATKQAGALGYQVHQVTAWRGLTSRQAPPDRVWFGSLPTLHADLRGELAEQVLARLEDSLARYPHASDYAVWPGPNSNTFTAWVIRDIPELRAQLPSNAIGKDYLSGRLWARTPSDSGYQLSLNGVVGFMAAREEGLELNLLGLVVGIDPLGLAIKLPGLGRFGLLPASIAGNWQLEPDQEAVY